MGKVEAQVLNLLDAKVSKMLGSGRTDAGQSRDGRRRIELRLAGSRRTRTVERRRCLFCLAGWSWFRAIGALVRRHWVGIPAAGSLFLFERAGGSRRFLAARSHGRLSLWERVGVRARSFSRRSHPA